ncbi:hypothetical protein PROFUN_12170 [Planoprotostelium fungivorum]|uniref:Uncharacterized protein n=1 Tax=Planoprotostelium fungivorum TaxID=1890364 RepID=A0A2P6N8F3_9EUKA|nr:hypothetical protein PROFUN_12170 [Planoprotostelium fungivorum]
MEGGDVEVRLTISQQDSNAASLEPRQRGAMAARTLESVLMGVALSSSLPCVCVDSRSSGARGVRERDRSRSLSFLVEVWIGPLSTKQLLRPLQQWSLVLQTASPPCRRCLERSLRRGDDILPLVLLQVADEWISVVDSLFLMGFRADPLSCADNDRFFVGCGGTSLSLSGITSDGHVPE